MLRRGWLLGNRIDGTQAEFVRVPHADGSLHRIPDDCDEEAIVMLSDILPTGYECGVLNGRVQPGDSVVIVGGGPIGLATLLMAQFYSPAFVVAGRLHLKQLITHRFPLTETVKAYEVFGHAESTGALKVISAND